VYFRGAVVNDGRPPFGEFHLLVRTMAKHGDIGPFVSEVTLAKCLAEWLQAELQSRSATTFGDSLLGFMNSMVAEYAIIFALAGTFVDGELHLGRVRIHRVSNDERSRWLAGWRDENEANASLARFTELALSQDFHKRPAAFVEVKAEPVRAYLAAVEAVEEALAVLRMASPFLTDPRDRDYCAILGFEHPDLTRYTLLKPNGEFGARSVQLEPGPRWMASQAMLSRAPVSTLVGLLGKVRSEFEELVMAAVSLFSQSSLEAQSGRRLLTAVGALESLFLRNSTEPIQDNLATRMAYVVTDDVDERVRIVEVVKRAYSLRSRVVHHGASLEDLETMGEFLFYAARSVFAVVACHGQYETKDAYLAHIDRRRLAG
jgi:hypothetical protein